MDTFDKRKFTIRALRFSLALSLFTATSLFSNFLSYFIAQRLTNEVSEDVIRVIHIIISLLAYHSLFYAFISTDNVIRKEYFDGNIGKIKYIATNPSVKISFVTSLLFFAAFHNAFALESLRGWLEIPIVYACLTQAFAFFVVLILTWVECLFVYQRDEEKSRKEKRKIKDTRILIKSVISAMVAYPIMAYLLPIFFPTLRTLPKVVFSICVVVVPILAVLVVIFSFFAYVRAFFIRAAFVQKLKKAAVKKGWTLSKIEHTFSSLFMDIKGKNFTICANGKVYDCKLLSCLHYGDPMHFEENGKGKIVRHISLRYRARMGAPFARGGLIWQKLPDDIAQFHTEFSYGFDSENKKVIIICPTAHSIYATGQGQNRLLDVNDVVFGYTVMTATAFINALNRDAIK